MTDSLACPDGCGAGIGSTGGTGNLIARNFVARASRAGIWIADFEDEGGLPEINNVVERNLVVNSEIDGVLVESTVTDTLLERNIAIGAGDDGIDVDSPTTSLRRNTANGNGDLGIEAEPASQTSEATKPAATATHSNVRTCSASSRKAPGTRFGLKPDWDGGARYGQRLSDLV